MRVTKEEKEEEEGKEEDSEKDDDSKEILERITKQKEGINDDQSHRPHTWEKSD